MELGNGVLARSPRPHSLNAHLPPPYLVVHLVLRLIEQDEPDLASDLIEAFQERSTSSATRSARSTAN